MTMIKTIYISFLLFFTGLQATVAQQSQTGNSGATAHNAETHWYRGNTHTHARYSDKHKENDVPEIAKWYRKAGYDFLVLSEHNDLLKKNKTYCHDEAGRPPQFIMICGLELSGSHHVTAFGINSFISGEKSIQDAVDRTKLAGGIPILNHPMQPVITAVEFLGVKGLRHMEVFNGNSLEDTPACERLWDQLLSLSSGHQVFAVASDDNHYKKSKVGRGFIMVNSPELTAEAVKKAVDTGNFYASTGIILKNYTATDKSLTVVSENGNTVYFIGLNGKVLKKVTGNGASYIFDGSEKYVRVKITNEAGMMCWTQPVFKR